jgi:hypothetical protein
MPDRVEVRINRYKLRDERFHYLALRRLRCENDCLQLAFGRKLTEQDIDERVARDFAAELVAENDSFLVAAQVAEWLSESPDDDLYDILKLAAVPAKVTLGELVRSLLERNLVQHLRHVFRCSGYSL